MMAAWVPAELKAMARGSMTGGTSMGVSACCAGIWKARPMPSTTDRPSSSPRDTQASWVDSSSTKPTAICSSRQLATMRARWNWSATCPATRVSSRAGRNW